MLFNVRARPVMVANYLNSIALHTKSLSNFRLHNTILRIRRS